MSHRPLIPDPFADLGDEQPTSENLAQEKKAVPVHNYVHIRIQQRNGRKTLTTLQGLPKGKSSYLSLAHHRV